MGIWCCASATGTLTRINGARTVTIQAGIREGVQAQTVRDEVTAQLAYIREWGGRFVTAVPTLEVL